MSDMIGDKVYVKTPLFEGWATITGRVECSFYPTVITLDKGDSDGFKNYRICKDDIIKRK